MTQTYLGFSFFKTIWKFGILKLGTRPQGGESKRSADNFGHCYLFGICYLLFGNSGYSITPVLLSTLDYLDATDHGPLTTDKLYLNGHLF